MKVLIVYYSFTGNNAVLAAELEDRLNADLYEIKELKQRTGFTILFDLIFKRTPKIEGNAFAGERYDKIIFLGPVWNGKIATPLKAFIRNQRNKLRSYTFVTICSGREGQQEMLKRELTILVGRPPEQLIQLSLNDLLPPERKRDSKSGISYKIDKSDLTYFDPALASLTEQFAVA